MPKVIDLKDQVFGRLTAKTFQGIQVGTRKALWKCLCQCGNYVVVSSGNLRQGAVLSCGCLRNERSRAACSTHGMTNSFEYSCWQNMLNRCRNPNVPAYKDYGKRGIKVCRRWLEFENFLADMGLAPTKTHSINRKENDGDYAPTNCHWATEQEQQRNKRSNRILTLNGDSMTVAEWAMITGISSVTLRARLDNLGWDIERTLTTPLRGQTAILPPTRE